MMDLYLKSNHADLHLMISPEDGESWERWWWLPAKQVFVIASYCPDNFPPFVIMTSPADVARQTFIDLVLDSYWEVVEVNRDNLPWTIPTAEEMSRLEEDTNE